MHPQIVRDAPGFCPICGMALEPRTVTGEEKNEELIRYSMVKEITSSSSMPGGSSKKAQLMS